MKNYNTNTDNSPDWLTPPEIIESLGEFTLDPCTPETGMPKALYPEGYPIPTTYGPKEDGLAQKWDGHRVWLNPPYGRETFKFIRKLNSSPLATGIALIPCRTETRGFHEEIFNFASKAVSVFFFRGRLCFYRADGTRGNTANFPSCLVTFHINDFHIIEDSDLIGHHVLL